MDEYLKHYAESKSQTEKNTCDTIYLKLQGRKSNTSIESRSMSSKAGGQGKVIRKGHKEICWGQKMLYISIMVYKRSKIFHCT